MLAQNLILIFACLNYAVSQSNLFNNTKSPLNEEIDAWETEIEKTITVKLKNKIEEDLERRLEKNLEKVLEDILKTKLRGIYNCCNKDKQEPLAWIQTTARGALAMSDCAVVAGYEGHDRSPLWVIRARHEGNLLPGKLAIKHNTAFVASNGTEIPVDDIEVFCTRPGKVRWVSSHGSIPPNALIGGYTSTGMPLYVGRAKQGKSLTPGQVHSDQKVLFISFAGKEILHKSYDILCLA